MILLKLAVGRRLFSFDFARIFPLSAYIKIKHYASIFGAGGMGRMYLRFIFFASWEGLLYGCVTLCEIFKLEASVVLAKSSARLNAKSWVSLVSGLVIFISPFQSCLKVINKFVC